MIKKILTLYCYMLLSICTIAQEAPIKISFGNMTARSIGPAVMSGRITSIDAVNNNPQVLYIGSASGGLWKSTSAGANFRPVFDDHTMSIGAVTVDQNHPDTVWVGTGEPWVRNSVSVGNGIFVSTNGGNTWQFKGLEKTERIPNVLIDPRNSSTIYAAAQGNLWNANEERGVYKSTDFGTTWERILFVDENTGCADLSMDPSNPDVLYAAMWEHRRSPDFFNSGGAGSALYKTTDGGKSWNKIHNGLPEGILGRIAVAVAPSNPQTIYATVEADKEADKGLYKSTDAGANWILIEKSFNTKVRPFYFSRIVVDPSDENILFKCGLNLIVSENGGDSFRAIGSGVHSDSHAIWINPNNSKHVVIGTDGGAYRSLDGAYTFEMFMDLPLSQFYHVSVDNEEPYNIYGGLQDNGTWFGPSASPGGVENKDWRLSNWGDGFYSFRHPKEQHIIYSESQEGGLVRYNSEDGQAKNIKPIPSEGDPDYRFNWNSPIHLSPTNPERIYFAAQFLFKSENRGDTWQKISPDLTTNDPNRQRQPKSGGLSIDNSGAENNTTISVIAESPTNENIIWVGTDDGNLQVTTDSGQNWTNVASNIAGLPQFTWCSSVEPSRYNQNTCYVTFDGHKGGDKNVYVYKTTDLGKNWTSLVTEDIEGYAHCIVEDYEAANLLFLGTEFGLYISVDGGVSWKRFKNNLPKVSVRAMDIQARESALVLGTHGRGIFIIDDLMPLRQINPEVVNQTLHFFKSKPAHLTLASQGRPFGGAGNFVGANPKDVAYITYYMKKRHTFGKMTVGVYDENGNLVKELPAGKSAGINIVELPIRLPSPKAAPTKNRMALFGSAIPPTLPEGSYTVKIKKGKEAFETKVDLIFDPKADYSAADRKLGFETQMTLYNLTEQMAYIYDGLKDLEEQAADRSSKSKKKLAAQLSELSESVKAYKNSLISLEGDFYVHEGSNLREEISTLYFGISQYPGKPTSGQLQKTEWIKKQMAEVQSKFEGFKSQMMDLNPKLTKAELKEMKLKTFEEFKKK